MVSLTTKSDMFKEETGEGLLVLLTIDHADLASPIRVVANQEDIISRGETFTAFPFDIELPTMDGVNPPRARLTIDNVSREIGQAVRAISSSATVDIEVVRTDDFNTVELSMPQFILRNVSFDAAKVTGDLMSRDLQLEPYPAQTFNPSYFPGLF